MANPFKIDTIEDIIDWLEELDQRIGRGMTPVTEETLRVPCDPYANVSFGEHKHRCPSCQTTWKHTDGLPGATSMQHQRAHTCPNCETLQFWKYD